MSLKDYFWPEDPKNAVKRTYCKACVSRQLDSVGATTTGVVEGSQAFKDSGGGFTVGTDGDCRGRSQTMYGAVEIDSDEFQLILEPRFKALWADTVESWLLRSGHIPLSISLAGGIGIQDGGRDLVFELLFHTLMKHSCRWEHMRFRLPAFPWLKPLKALSPNHVPLLKTIAITAWHGFDKDPTVFSFLGATALRGVSLECLPGPGLQPCIPWTQLRHLSLQSLGLERALRLIQQCPNLETWRSSITDTPKDTLPAPKSIHVARLQTLCIIDRTQGRSTRFFEYAVFSNLHSFEYASHYPGVEPTPILSSLCAPEKLTSLSLSTYMSTDSLAETLRRFPMLQHLVLHRPRNSLRYGVVACRLFTLLSTRDTLCPHLKSICSLALDVGTDEELSTMIDVRQTRHDVQRLLRIHVVFPRARQVDVSPQPAAANLTATLRYPTKREWTEATKPFDISAKPRDRDTGEDFDKRCARSAPAVDWGPRSDRWMAEYEEWGYSRTRKMSKKMAE
ncbi:hypothetical protein FB451DRAFT_1521015 [Mycena latifolia]|nr:hypothetical protein FB451DRAFT_1521015 [Mycena latifolia]